MLEFVCDLNAGVRLPGLVTGCQVDGEEFRGVAIGKGKLSGEALDMRGLTGL